MRFLLLPLLFASGLAGAGELRVRDAWIRTGPPGAPLAGYATFDNPGPGTLRVVAAESPAFERVELHEMRMAEGLMRMRKLDGLDVPAGASVAFAPGGDHLMLHGAKQPLAAGDAVEIEFVDAVGVRTRARFEVRAPR
jgi:copper(I)-binding protein